MNGFEKLEKPRTMEIGMESKQMQRMAELVGGRLGQEITKAHDENPVALTVHVQITFNTQEEWAAWREMRKQIQREKHQF